MKVNSYSFAASAVAFSATVLALPALYKRVADGSKVFKCFADAIASGNWPTECAVAVMVDVGIAQGVNVGFLDLGFNPTAPTILSFGSSVTVQLISVPLPNFKWPLTECAQHVALVNNNNTIASYDNPTAPVTVTNGVLAVSINTAIKIPSGQEDNFSAFMSSLITQANHNFTLRGNFNATVKTTAPPLSPIPASFEVNNIAFEVPITLKGCANFPNIKVLQQGNFTLDPATGFYILKFTANINNLSQMILSLGHVTYQLTNKNVVVGTVLFDDVNLKIGDNPLTAVATITDKTVYDTLVRTGATLGLQGFAGSSTHPILAKAIEPLRSQIPFLKANGVQP